MSDKVFKCVEVVNKCQGLKLRPNLILEVIIGGKTGVDLSPGTSQSVGLAYDRKGSNASATAVNSTDSVAER